MFAIPVFLLLAGYKRREIYTLLLWVVALISVVGSVVLVNWLVKRKKSIVQSEGQEPRPRAGNSKAWTPPVENEKHRAKIDER
jgi:hypothetical protein